ncbi:MAG: protein-export chaperone SecB [Gammaproteobacteria bacterium]|nr:MAG: protein-export chaperone SecB [Gammaproteobacteria bacterium]
MEEKNPPQFAIQRIYVKDVSFESPSAPHIFTGPWSPKMNLQIGSKAASLGEDHYEVVLSVTATATQDDKTAFLVEVHQAGIFMVKGYEPQQLDAMLGSYCPNVLFPFAREVVADLVTKGGFPPLLLAPINFDALYAQRLKQKAQETTD